MEEQRSHEIVIRGTNSLFRCKTTVWPIKIILHLNKVIKNPINIAPHELKSKYAALLTLSTSVKSRRLDPWKWFGQQDSDLRPQNGPCLRHPDVRLSRRVDHCDRFPMNINEQLGSPSSRWNRFKAHFEDVRRIREAHMPLSRSRIQPCSDILEKVPNRKYLFDEIRFYLQTTVLG